MATFLDTRLLALVGAGMIVASAPATGQSASPPYTVQDLSPGVPSAINNAGEIAGLQYVPRVGGVLGPQAAVYRDGAWVLIADLEDPYPEIPFNSYSALAGINDAGQAVGRSYKILVAFQDTLSRGATVGRSETELTQLPIPADVYAGAINRSGRIVGSRDEYLDINPDHDRAFAFDLADGTLTDLDALLPGPREDSYAKDVNSAGDVVGYFWLNGVSQPWRGFLFDQDTQSLRLLDDSDGDIMTWALAVNDRREVVGEGLVGGVGRQAVLFDAGAGTVSGLPTPPQTLISRANDINNRGHVVGSMVLGSSNERAFLYRNGAVQDLNDLIAPGSGWTLREAVSINDGGQIVGRGVPPGAPGQIGYFLLTPTPQSQVGGLIQAVRELEASGMIGGGNANALIVKLEGAISQLDKGKVTPAVNKIEAFVNQVEAFIATGKLTSAQGQPLIDEANSIIATLTS